MTDSLSDFRCSLRMLGRTPGFTAVAVLTLALGIGVNTAVFSLVDALLLRFLPFPSVERLVFVESTHAHSSTTSVGPGDFRDWQAENTVFDQMAYTSFSQLNFTGQSFPGFGEPEQITGTEVSQGFFPLLGVEPLMGRWFLPEEQNPNRSQVVILNYNSWLRRFGGKPDILGQTLTLGGRGYTVIGVMPASFRLNAGYASEYWVPIGHSASGRRIHQYSAYARLKPGVAVEAAQAQMNAIAARLARAYPETNTGWGVRVTRFQDFLLKVFGPAMAIFAVAVGVVLLIACANFANLLLARSRGRMREIAIRRALGAGRFRVARLLLMESVIVSVAGGALGLLLAYWGVEYAAGAAPAWMELKSIVHVDRMVLGFTLLLSMLTGVLTGIAPVLQALRADVNRDLKQGESGAAAGSGRSWVRNALVVWEVALATLLLVVAGLLTRSFERVLQADLGFRTAGILTLRMQLPSPQYRDPQRRAKFVQDLLERVRSLPGAISAGVVDAIPMGGVHTAGEIEIAGRPMPRDWEQVKAAYREATPDYFRTLDIPLRRGRYFSDVDRGGSEPVVIVNEALVRQFFANEDPLGRRIRAGGSEWRTIVGVVGDVRHGGPETPPRAETYCPYAQRPAGHMFLVVRTAAAPSILAGPVRAEVRALDRNLPVTHVRTMEEAFSESIVMRRQLMALVGFFGAMALLLAALGLGGVMWHSVSRRTHEIGLRMALGAQPGDVVRLVFTRGLSLTLAGLAIGLGASLAATRLLGSLLYGVGPKDPLALVLAPLALVATAVAAVYLPARHASRIDPLAALREE